MDFCFLVYICFEHRSHIQTVHDLVGAGFDSISLAFVSNSVSHLTTKKPSNRSLGAGVDTICSYALGGDSPTSC